MTAGIMILWIIARSPAILTTLLLLAVLQAKKDNGG